MALTEAQKQELEKEIRAYVGRPIGPPALARDPVNEPMIRQWCEVMGDQLPIYWDAEAAKRSVHGGLVAPPWMLQAWTMQGWEMRLGYDEPRNEEHRLHKLLTDAGYTGVLGTDTEQSFGRYLRPGDVVTVNTVIEHISEEKATGAGTGYFITTRSTFTDQTGAEVGWQRFRVLKFIPKERPASAAAPSAQPAAPSRIKPPMGHDNAWWWEEVAKGKLPIQRCAGCKKLRHPPRPMCGDCGSMQWDFVESSGIGTVHTYTVVHYPHFPGYDFPIVAALVDLEEGTRIMSDLVGVEPKDVHIGMKVRAFVHTDPDGFKLPRFKKL
jgi:uncharacterized OB-fold protein/acyl dehydratase